MVLDASSDEILILPSISVGNVGQMAIDWILTNAKSPPFERIANPLPESCWSWLQPMTAVASLSELEGDAGGGKMTSKLTLPLEWYRCGPVTVLQQRAPCVPGQWKWFLEELKQWVSTTGRFKRIVVLAGADATRRLDAELQRPLSNVYFLTDAPWDQPRDTAEWLNQLDHTANRMLSAPHPEFEPDSLVLPGAGATAQYMLRQLNQVVPVTVLFLYTVEGENIQESIQLARVAMKALEMPLPLRESGQIPKAWQHLYGEQPDASLFQ